MNETLDTVVETAEEVTQAHSKKVLLVVLGIAATAIIGTVWYKKHKANKVAKMLSVAEAEVENVVSEVTEEPKSEDEE
nr:MAG TPA: ATPase [Caudoviricetes sp.]